MLEDKEKKINSQYVELEVSPGINRRQFLGIMGASMALSGIAATGCIRKPKEYIYAESERPENTLPGVAKHYATSALIANAVLGLSVTSTDGRPTKIDGNFRHPMNNPITDNTIGSSNTYAQAEILNLYDPQRGQHCLEHGKISNKTKVLQNLKELVLKAQKNQGKGLALLYATTASPTFINQLHALQKIYPQALFIEQDSTYSENRLLGLKQIADTDVDLVYDLAKAKIIVALDADFLGIEGDSVKNARQFAQGRKVKDPNSEMNRLYSIESNISITGAAADHRYTLASALIPNFLLNLVEELKVLGLSLSQGLSDKLVPKVKLEANLQKWLLALAKDLIANKNSSLIIIGDKQPAWVHALGLALNEALGAVKQKILLVLAQNKPYFVQNIQQLQRATADNAIEDLIIIGANPSYMQPIDINFNKILQRVKNSFYLNLYPDETAQLSKYYLPQTHFLESWGDTLSKDGTLALRQPLIAPLFDDCMNEYEFLAYLVDTNLYSAYDIIKNNTKNLINNVLSTDIFEQNWRQYLSDGFVYKFAAINHAKQNFNFKYITEAYYRYNILSMPTAENLQIEFVLDRSVYDGRYAYNSWLQELPDSIYKLVWDNALLMNSKTAKALGVCGMPKPGKNAVDLVQLSYQGNTVKTAVWETVGIPDFVVIFPLGYGRKFADNSLSIGFNANLIRRSGAWYGSGAQIEKTGETYALVSAQEHAFLSANFTKEADRPPAIRNISLKQFKQNPKSILDYELLAPEEQKNNLFPYPTNPAHTKTARQQWGMTIDLTSCIGCNACTIACQAENNIAVVGKEEVFRNRIMHWMRIDRYFSKNADSPEVQTFFQPMNCQQCENAPCEAVCPVAATTHSPDGLNDMTYNRCVGTRYCANNCPYKVRRYNFFNYSKIDDEENPLYAMQKNPNVTVRFRGVMEKCTYCVQRINAAKIEAKLHSDDELIADGDLRTACQSVCPANAISFGDIADPNSAVAKSKSLATNYSVLGELNTKPRTTYLAKINNLNS